MDAGNYGVSGCGVCAYMDMDGECRGGARGGRGVGGWARQVGFTATQGQDRDRGGRGLNRDRDGGVGCPIQKGTAREKGGLGRVERGRAWRR